MDDPVSGDGNGGDGGLDAAEVVACMDEAVVVVDGAGRIDRVNPAAETLVGRPADALEGRPVAEALPSLSAPVLDRDGPGGADRSDPGSETGESDPGSEAGESGPGSEARESGPGSEAVKSDPGSEAGESDPGSEAGESEDGTTADGGTTRARVTIPGPDGDRECAARYAPCSGGWVVTLRDVTDRARRRAELERYERVVEASGDPMYAVDADGRFTFVNEALAEMTGYGVADLLGRHGSTVVPDEEADHLADLVGELLASDRTTETHETAVVTEDGRRVPVENHIAILPGDDGEGFGGSAGVLRDVSDRLAREAELERYEKVVETVPDGVLVFDAEGRIEGANHRAAAMLGRADAGVIGRTLGEFAQAGVVPEEVPGTYEELVGVLTAADTETQLGSFEFEVTPDGSGVERVCTLDVALREADGEFAGTVAVLHDVTDRKAYERDLERHKTIVETVGDPVYATDEEGRFTYVNRAFESVTGHDAAVVEEEFRLSDFLAPGDRGRVREVVEELRATEDHDRATLEVTGVRADGRRIPIEDRVALLPDEDGGFAGTAGVFRDVTERKRRQEVLSVMNRALRHNLRTNVNAIVGFADVVGSETDDDRLREYCAHIYDAGQWLADLGDTLRTLQDAVDERRQGEAAVDAGHLVEEAVATVRERHDARIHVETASVPLDAGPTLSHALEQVVENAVVHGEDPDVTVRVREADAEGWVDVVVADDGPGIPRPEREVVLGDAPIDQLSHGSGLGLWITRWIVEVFGGRIEIDDREPTGSVVTLRLRRADAASLDGAPPDPLLRADGDGR